MAPFLPETVAEEVVEGVPSKEFSAEKATFGVSKAAAWGLCRVLR